jgi:hypothetical protein
MQSAEQYIQAAKRHGIRTSRSEYDIFLTVPRADWEYGAALTDEFRRTDVKVFNAAESLLQGPYTERPEEALTISKAFVFIAGRDPDPGADNYLNQFLRHSLDD